MIQAGKLRHRVTILRPRRVPNALGEPQIVYQPSWHVWASVVPLNSREIIHERGVELRTTHRVTLRYFPGLTGDCRLSFSSGGGTAPRLLDIVGLTNVGERNEAWEIAAAEGSASQ